MRDFNFFSPYIDKSKQKKDRTLFFGIGAAVIAFAIVGTFLWNSISTIKLNSDIKALNEELNKPDKIEKLRKAEELIKKQEIMNSYFDGIKVIYSSVESRNTVTSVFMQSLTAKMPQGVSFKSMAIDGQNVQVQGIAKTRAAIAELQYNLKNLSSVSEVSISSIAGGTDKSTNGEYTFSLKCTLKDVEKNANK
jgi:type IV pilus assembly protein PilN